MKITLVKKLDQADTAPMLVQYIDETEKGSVKKTLSVGIGQTMDLPDDIAIEVMAKYRGCFKAGEGVNLSEKARGYADKSVKAVVSKVLSSEAE